TGAPNSCPYGWVTYKKSCYKIFLKAKTWTEAEMFCVDQKTGCHLASIHGVAESFQLAKYISRYLSFTNVWIGLKDPKQQRVWRWSDGSSTGYTSWTRGGPNSLWHNDDCAELQSWSGYVSWNIRDCNFLRAFLCQCPL
ncbi:C-type lectin-like, partial [Python bivittatus]|uniref:C-type lectin-like n=1 Tax=Python bivittatus TaxID=176946 RepID=A0A9F2WIG5_PYTBI